MELSIPILVKNLFVKFPEEHSSTFHGIVRNDLRMDKTIHSGLI